MLDGSMMDDSMMVMMDGFRKYGSIMMDQFDDGRIDDGRIDDG